jgi:hypothetical protein
MGIVAKGDWRPGPKAWPAAIFSFANGEAIYLRL